MQLSHRERVMQEGSTRNVRAPPSAFGLPAVTDGEPISHRTQVVDEASRASADATDPTRQASQHIEPDEPDERSPSGTGLRVRVSFDEEPAAELVTGDKPQFSNGFQQRTVTIGKSRVGGIG
jgi:hypothetical protein